MSTEKEENKKYDDLTFEYKNAWKSADDTKEKEVFEFCEGYKDFMNNAKTEREVVDEVVKMVEDAGFINFNDLLDRNDPLPSGQKVYYVNKNKSMLISVIGSNPLEDGINILGSHIDSPRVDLKQTPVYEDTELAFFETHYYGGIKKYQWVTIPLALHGVIYKSDGSVVKIKIGENENEPVFMFTDLLPHLAQEQMQKKMSQAITGEGLNLLIGSMPVRDENVSDNTSKEPSIKNPVKINILKILHEKYNIAEKDFVSAEIEIVPAFKACDIGFDRSMIGAYGHDDRSCAYPAVMAMLDVDCTPDRTLVCILTDKEEIGSVGNTSAQSSFFMNFLVELCSRNLSDRYINTPNGGVERTYRRCLDNSYMLSADVNAAVDPNYDGVHDKRNASYINKGIVLEKYTGSRGKSDASDANPEFIAEIIRAFDENGVVWQTGDLGKVDLGGGGTIAKYIANLGVEVLDCGIPLLSMHAPYEIAGKIDIYETYKGYKAFLKL